MTHSVSRAALALVLLAPAAVSAQQFAGWHSSLDRAAELSAKSGKPIFAVFRCER
jgi:hypothetical protein